MQELVHDVPAGAGASLAVDPHQETHPGDRGRQESEERHRHEDGDERERGAPEGEPDREKADGEVGQEVDDEVGDQRELEQVAPRIILAPSPARNRWTVSTNTQTVSARKPTIQATQRAAPWSVMKLAGSPNLVGNKENAHNTTFTYNHPT